MWRLWIININLSICFLIRSSDKDRVRLCLSDRLIRVRICSHSASCSPITGKPDQVSPITGKPITSKRGPAPILSFYAPRWVRKYVGRKKRLQEHIPLPSQSHGWNMFQFWGPIPVSIRDYCHWPWDSVKENFLVFLNAHLGTTVSQYATVSHVPRGTWKNTPGLAQKPEIDGRAESISWYGVDRELPWLINSSRLPFPWRVICLLRFQVLISIYDKWPNAEYCTEYLEIRKRQANMMSVNVHVATKVLVGIITPYSILRTSMNEPTWVLRQNMLKMQIALKLTYFGGRLESDPCFSSKSELSRFDVSSHHHIAAFGEFVSGCFWLPTWNKDAARSR